MEGTASGGRGGCPDAIAGGLIARGAPGIGACAFCGIDFAADGIAHVLCDASGFSLCLRTTWTNVARFDSTVFKCS